MGFDVIYLPPIHPIGRSFRKGRNNALEAGPDDPGSPWAIGNEHGGHKAIEPALGTLADFRAFLRSSRDHGLEVALDYALQCSPDHPWVTEHPEWFHHRPDGTIKYAENPPKKYQDIYPLNFYGREREALWEEAKGILLFWIEQGVRIFRVDNPHTKPLPFWSWVIGEVQAVHPDVIFLAEAFTRPKVMQSPREARLHPVVHVLHVAELQAGAGRLPDRADPRGDGRVLPRELLREHAGHPAPHPAAGRARGLQDAPGAGGDPLAALRHLQRLRALRERRDPGTEEYLDSEKYEIKVRDWSKPGNIKRVRRRGSTGSAGRTGRSTSTGISSSTRATTSTSSATGSGARTATTPCSWR